MQGSGQGQSFPGHKKITLEAKAMVGETLVRTGTDASKIERYGGFKSFTDKTATLTSIKSLYTYTIIPQLQKGVLSDRHKGREKQPIRW